MKRRPKVAISGAGMAGLCAGAILASRGVETVICEASSSLGGLVGSFRRDGHLWDKGARAIENSGVFLPLLKMLGLEARISLVPDPVSLGLEGSLYPIGDESGERRWWEALRRRYPDSAAGISLLERDAGEAVAASDRLYGGNNPIFEPFPGMLTKALVWNLRNRRIFADMAEGRGLLAEDLLEHLAGRGIEARVARVISQPFFAGTTVFFGMGYARLFRDYLYPLGGTQAFPDLLAAYIRERGGTIRLGEPVKEIAMSAGKAKGLVLESGEFVGADGVIGACHAQAVPAAGSRTAPGITGAMPGIEGAMPGESVVTAFFALDLDPRRGAGSIPDQGIGHAIHAPDAEGGFLSGRKTPGGGELFTSSSIEISVPCLRDPAASPEGKSGFIVSAGSPHGTWLEAEARGPGAVEAAKAQAAEALAEAMETLVPGFRGRIESVFVGTPRTLERETRNPGGSITGWSLVKGECGAETDFRKFAKAVEGGAPNAWRAGHWTFAPAGIPVALMTGKLAADLLTLRLDPRRMMGAY